MASIYLIDSTGGIISSVDSKKTPVLTLSAADGQLNIKHDGTSTVAISNIQNTEAIDRRFKENFVSISENLGNFAHTLYDNFIPIKSNTSIITSEQYSETTALVGSDGEWGYYLSKINGIQPIDHNISLVGGNTSDIYPDESRTGIIYSDFGRPDIDCDDYAALNEMLQKIENYIDGIKTQIIDTPVANADGSKAIVYGVHKQYQGAIKVWNNLVQLSATRLNASYQNKCLFIQTVFTNPTDKTFVGRISGRLTIKDKSVKNRIYVKADACYVTVSDVDDSPTPSFAKSENYIALLNTGLVMPFSVNLTEATALKGGASITFQFKVLVNGSDKEPEATEIPANIDGRNIVLDVVYDNLPIGHTGKEFQRASLNRTRRVFITPTDQTTIGSITAHIDAVATVEPVTVQSATITPPEVISNINIGEFHVGSFSIGEVTYTVAPPIASVAPPQVAPPIVIPPNIIYTTVTKIITPTIENDDTNN